MNGIQTIFKTIFSETNCDCSKENYALCSCQIGAPPYDLTQEISVCARGCNKDVYVPKKTILLNASGVQEGPVLLYFAAPLLKQIIHWKFVAIKQNLSWRALRYFRALLPV